MKRTVISEYVGLGHPDKVADLISDALLDEFLRFDTNTRAGIEVMIKDNIVVLGGEVKSTAQTRNIEFWHMQNDFSSIIHTVIKKAARLVFRRERTGR